MYNASFTHHLLNQVPALLNTHDAKSALVPRFLAPDNPNQSREKVKPWNSQ